MELRHALDRIDEIHDHLSRSEVYRGVGPRTLALTALLAAVAAAAQPARGFAAYWTAVAVLGALVGTAPILVRCVSRGERLFRIATGRILAQFAPCVVAGAAAAFALRDAAGLLPGLWSMLFGVGLFAARPYLPRTSGFVGLFYLTAGAWLLAVPGTEPWRMGTVFGAGQLAAAAVLRANLERDDGR